MPGMDGLEATRQIKMQFEPPRIIALTARVMTNDRSNIFSAGCDGIIEKPIDPKNFASQVKLFLERA